MSPSATHDAAPAVPLPDVLAAKLREIAAQPIAADMYGRMLVTTETLLAAADAISSLHVECDYLRQQLKRYDVYIGLPSITGHP